MVVEATKETWVLLTWLDAWPSRSGRSSTGSGAPDNVVADADSGFVEGRAPVLKGGEKSHSPTGETVDVLGMAVIAGEARSNHVRA